jgi:hypothetical protein
MNLPKLYYCETHYNCNPPVDINPLIIQRYNNYKILVFCPREQVLVRVCRLNLPNLLAVGWWELEDIGLVKNGFLDKEELYYNDIVVIIGKRRVDITLMPLVKQVESLLQCQ